MRMNKKALSIISLTVLSSLMFVVFQNFTAKNKGMSYLFDGFEVEGTSQKIWTLRGASCNQVPHLIDGKYPTLGQTIRPGECVFREDRATGNHFLRFITHPFDRRDATYKGVTLYEDSVDHGKGGAEIRASAASLYNGNRGWDLSGEQYLRSGNKVRYSFDFRIYNLSIIETREDSTRKDLAGNKLKYKLANSSTITQFHSKQITKDRFGNLKSCGNYYPGSAPSPGLDITESEGDVSSVDFKLFLKLFREDIPTAFIASIKTCSTQLPRGQTNPALKRELCLVEVWSKTYKKVDVVKKWFSASVIINSDIRNGSLEFFFGSKDSNATSENLYQRVAFNNQKRIIAPLATQHNNCPSTIYLGNYVLGYNQEMYGYYKNSFLSKNLSDSAPKELVHDACKQKLGRYDRHRFCQGDSFVHDNFKNEFGRFIDGDFNPLTESPPMLIVDYDNFRIIQE